MESRCLFTCDSGSDAQTHYCAGLNLSANALLFSFVSPVQMLIFRSPCLQPAYCIWMKLLHQCVTPLNFCVHRLLFTKKFDFSVCYYLFRHKTARENKHFGLHLSQIQSKSGHSMQVKLTNFVILKPINFEFCRSSLKLFLPIAN